MTAPVTAARFVAAFLLAAPLAAPATASAQEPGTVVSGPCAAPEHRQFDFWVGEWEVRDPSGRVVGTNSIAREYEEGCVLVERWRGASGFAGTSQNFWLAGDGRWHQNWIDHRATGPLWLSGGLDGRGAMVMTDVDPGATPKNRITWTPNPDGTVRQRWEQSSDGGGTWTTVFDGMYARREGSASADAATAPSDGGTADR